MNAATLAAAQMGAHTVRFPSVLRDEDRDRRPVTAITLTIPLAAVDIEAVFWWLLDSGVTLDELTGDPGVAVFYLCEALAHADTETFTVTRAALAALRPGTADHALYQRVRDLVADLLTPTGPTPVTAGGGGGWWGRPGSVAHLPSWTGDVAHRTRCGHALSGMDAADGDARRCAVCVRSADAACPAARPVAVLV